MILSVVQPSLFPPIHFQLLLAWKKPLEFSSPLIGTFKELAAKLVTGVSITDITVCYSVKKDKIKDLESLIECAIPTSEAGF